MSVGTARSGRLDAVIVPTSRPASTLTGLIRSAAWHGAVLVVLCSGLSRVDQVADRVSRVPGARALIVDVPSIAAGRTPATSGEEFRAVSAGRSSDLSAKCNLGLRLARLHGWSKGNRG